MQVHKNWNKIAPKPNNPELLDYLLAIPAAIIYWWQGLFGDKCHHLNIVRDGKFLCKYCDKPMVRAAPNIHGVDK